MSSVSKKQIYLITGAVVLSILLYLAPTRTDKSETETSTPKPAQKTTVNFETELNKAKKSLEGSDLAEVNKLEGEISAGKGVNNILLESLAKKWDVLLQPFISAHYFELIAANAPTEKNWLNAAYRYFDAFKMAEDASVRAAWVDKAIACYTKVIEINPDNLDAKTDLGVCYTESPQPMTGIMMLRDVIKAKPEHENAQLNLGLLSMKSRQYAKAVDRFKKVLEINPKNIDVYLYLGEAFLQMKDTANAVKTFEKYKNESKDVSAKREVDLYLKKIKNN